MRFRLPGMALTVGLCAWGLAGTWPAFAAEGLGTMKVQSREIQESMKAALVQTEKNMGLLEPWQKKLFDEEVLPNYQRFIKDYRPGSAGMPAQVEVDQKSLEKFIAFYAPKALARPDLRLFAYLRPDPACAKCGEATDSIKSMIQTRMERRGLTTVWVTPEEVGNPSLDGRPLDERLAQLADQKNAAGALVVQWRLEPPDPLDAAHADENHYKLRTFLTAKGSAAVQGTSLLELKHQGVLDLMDNDSFEAAADKLLSDAYSQFGLKAMLASAAETAARDEVLLTVAGFKDFADYTRIKTALQTALKDVQAFDELRIARGEVTFRLQTRQPMEVVRSLVASAQVAPSHLTVVEAKDRSIRAEVK